MAGHPLTRRTGKLAGRRQALGNTEFSRAPPEVLMIAKGLAPGRHPPQRMHPDDCPFGWEPAAGEILAVLA